MVCPMKRYRFMAIALLISLVCNVSMAASSGSAAVEGTRGYIDEINRPPEPWKGPPRSGKQVYAYRCESCHARTTQGAPMPEDDIEWSIRARQGLDVLVKHAVEGFNHELMPPRGGCENCSDSELKAAVLYMLGKSGIRFDDKGAGRTK